MNDDQGASLAGCLIWCAVLLVVPLGWFLYSAFAPQLLLHGVTRALYAYRSMPAEEEIDLAPGVFLVGQSRDEVHAMLDGSAITSRPISDLPDVPGIVEGYLLEAGRDIACSYRLLITVYYGDDDLLQSAKVRKQSGNCI